MVECRSIFSLDTWSILNWHSIDTSIDTWSTLDWHLGLQLVRSKLSFDWCIWVGWQLAAYWPAVIIWCRLHVHQVSIGMSIEYQSRCQSRVSIKSVDWHLTAVSFSTHMIWELNSQGYWKLNLMKTAVWNPAPEWCFLWLCVPCVLASCHRD